MKISVKQQDLNRELVIAQQLISRGTRHFEFMALDVVSDKLMIQASDMDSNFSSTIACDEIEDGTVCVDARKFTELVKLINPKSEITINTNGTKLKVSTKEDKFNLVTIDRNAFPATPECKQLSTILVPAPMMRDAIEMVSFAMPSVENERYTMQCAHLVLQEEGFRLTTADGRRFVYIINVLPDEPLEDLDALIPDRALHSLEKLCSGFDGSISVSEDENHLYFVAGHRTLVTRKVIGSFPNVTKALVDGRADYWMVTVNAIEFKEALTKAKVMADYQTPSVRINVSGGVMTIRSEHENAGDASVTLPAEHSDTFSIELLVNSKLVLDFLAVVKSKEIVLDLSKPQTAFQLRPANDDKYTLRYVMMPMRNKVVNVP